MQVLVKENQDYMERNQRDKSGGRNTDDVDFLKQKIHDLEHKNKVLQKTNKN